MPNLKIHLFSIKLYKFIVVFVCVHEIASVTKEPFHIYNKKELSHSIKNNGRCLRYLAKCNKESNIINLMKVLVYDMMIMMLGITLGI
jgi:hypothetical protein